MRHVEERESLDVLRGAAVVGLTTTGAAKYQSLVRQLGAPCCLVIAPPEPRTPARCAPSYLVVATVGAGVLLVEEVRPRYLFITHAGARVLLMEEAAEVLEAHVIASLAPSTQQLLLIGDHQQLRPSAACYELGLKFGLTVSLFERAFLSRAPLVKLRTQRRMRPTISRLIKPLYPELLDHPSARGRPNISGLARNVHFITHAAPEEYQDGGVLSPRNVHEARRCRRCRRCCRRCHCYAPC